MALAAGRAAPRLPALLSVALAAAALVAAAERPPTIHFVTAADRATVEIRGLDPVLLAELADLPPTDWTAWFAVHTREASLPGAELPPLLGSYEIEGWGLRFTPRFPLAAGQTYVARFRRPSAPEGEIRETFSMPAVDLPPSTALTGVYPSISQVPENLLRVYLQFSAAMSSGNARHHIRLLDADGQPVSGPFVAPERELWSPDRTRLTLFFDPGRIKRGVGPNVEVGPPLRAGRRYRLEIDHELLDARGVPLVRDYFKEFDVRAPDRDQPRTADWVLDPPAGSDQPVRLTFPEPLDRGLLEGLIEVIDGDGTPVRGRVKVEIGETRWSFRPERGWSDGVYRIRVGTLLEDLAGNSLRRPFEAALGGSGGDTRTPYVDLPFQVAARSD